MEAEVEAQIAEELGAPYWISFSCCDGRHNCEGQLLADCARQLARNYPHLQAIGVNCTKPEYIASLIGELNHRLPEQWRRIRPADQDLARRRDGPPFWRLCPGLHESRCRRRRRLLYDRSRSHSPSRRRPQDVYGKIIVYSTEFVVCRKRRCCMKTAPFLHFLEPRAHDEPGQGQDDEGAGDGADHGADAFFGDD